MEDSELLRIVLSDINLKTKFGGILPADSLLNIYKPRGFFILNSDEKGQPGTHWCVFNFERDRTEFFDSLGEHPENYHAYFRDVMVARGLPYLYNTIRLQSTESSTCGLFCLYFCHFRARGIAFSNILHHFDPVDLEYNDRIVTQFYI